MTERQLVSLENKFGDANYYDLLQSYKALISRNSNQKKYKETLNLIMSGCINFLKYQQYDCASELAKTLIETYKVFNIPFNTETKSNVIKIYKDYKDNNSYGKIVFMREAIKWSIGDSQENKGAPEFHKLLGDTLAQSGDYLDAQKHYLFSDDPLALSAMLKKWIQEGDSEDKDEETDLYITRAVLGFLCVKKLDYANTLYTDFIKSLSPDQLTSPLINYLRFLLLTLERDALPLFNLLRQKYSTALKRDPQFSKYLDQIANIYYKVPVQQSGGLGSLLSNLLGGFGNMSGSQTTNTTSSSTNTNNDVHMQDEFD